MNSPIQQIEGVVQIVTFYNPENHYCVARVLTPGQGQITIVGPVPDIKKGGHFVFCGHWDVHQQYGPQFVVESFTPKLPVTIEGLKKYLGSGLIKGVGPAIASDIVDRFGLETFDVIENHPERLTEVRQLGKKKKALIVQGWETQKGSREIFLFLQKHNISTNYSLKIYRHYGHDSVAILQANPYRLADDIWGIGFKTADQIARDLGLSEKSAERLQAGLRFVLSNAAGDGHCYVPTVELVEKAGELLAATAEELAPQLAALAASGAVIQEADRNYLPPLYRAEVEAAAHLHRLAAGKKPAALVPSVASLEKIEQELRLSFSPEQKEAVAEAFRQKILVITGGPGTGKTTTLIAVTHLLHELKKEMALAAPTGRAAKRMSEATGFPAQTIHRLLEYNPIKNGFQKNERSPLVLDVLILDECSMIDVLLLRDVLCALPDRAQLVLVGDQDQLPSVGPGNVFRDIIGSLACTVINLNRIFRQAEESLIVVNAHRVNQGQLPLFKTKGQQNFFFIDEEAPEKIQATIVDLVSQRLPKTYHYDPLAHIQVISPMYKGEVGVTALNQLLQGTLNPHGKELQRGGTTFRVGDKVMQVRNNYDKNVFNGDLGRITLIDHQEQELEVLFEERVRYDFSELDEIVLAYAITVHKSQGSEYKVVILPFVTQHFMMLQRNLLYTAMTRAREILIVIGTTRALAIAVKNDRIKRRYTTLKEKLSLADA